MWGFQSHIQDLPKIDLCQMLTLCFFGSTSLTWHVVNYSYKARGQGNYY